MPIANCILTPKCINSSNPQDNLIDKWAKAANQSSEHMTINLLTSAEQLGNTYQIMANLQLPSLWSPTDVSALQTGLAKALSGHFSVPLSTVHIVTSIIESGQIVEDGKEVKWQS